jgi:hypothetical protein
MRNEIPTKKRNLKSTPHSSNSSEMLNVSASKVNFNNVSTSLSIHDEKSISSEKLNHSNIKIVCSVSAKIPN